MSTVIIVIALMLLLRASLQETVAALHKRRYKTERKERKGKRKTSSRSVVSSKLKL
jgi:hypothetical protein